MTTSLHTFRTVALGLALALGTGGVVACGSEPTSSGGPTNIQQQSFASGSGSSTSTRLMPLGEASSTMKSKTAEAPAKLVPAKLRTGTHQGFDRVVVEFVGEGTPGWHIDYTPTPFQQASGEELKMTGDTFLNINIDGTTYPFEIGVEAPELLPVKGKGPAVMEVVSGGTFEGRSQFVVGLRGDRRPYSVAFIENPKRLVIDFRS